MPQAIDLVINNGAGTPVAKTFTLMAPAAGYNAIAAWALKEGTIASVFPKITVLARPTGNASKKSQIKLVLPSSYTDTVTGLTKVGSAYEADISVSVPDDFPEALKNDAVAFTKNLVSHALIQSVMRDGSPAS
uniref:Capsid protein n=1 Tax=Leviviridae sp. TaxID=2027243 RepID=A0A514D398_9VIRU|nr:MAG: hypothetical protein H2Bulk35476_000003 [Leviviridae sp.]